MLPILSALPALSLGSKILLVVAFITTLVGLTAYKTWSLTSDHYEQKIQADKYITVVKTQEIRVLDQKSLTSALTKQKAQLEKDFANEREIKTYLVEHPSVAECSIGDDGLRLWNSENRGVEVQ